jgi:hypothetical protein
MRPLAILALVFATLAISSPVEEHSEPVEANEPVIPPGEDRCRRGYDECIAV